MQNKIFIAERKRRWKTIRRCTRPCSTPSPTHLLRSKSKITATQNPHSSLPSKKQKKCISQHRTEIEAALSGERSNAAPSEARGGSSKKEGRGPSLLVVRGCRGQNRNAPCLSLGGSKGGDSLLKENLPLCPVQRRWRCHPY